MSSLNPLSLSPRKQQLLLEAAYEIDALAHLLPGLLPPLEEIARERLQLRGQAMRFIQLADAIMSCVGDDIPSMRQLELKVYPQAPLDGEQP